MPFVSLALLSLLTVPQAPQPERITRDSLLEKVDWREVGPYRGGRSAAVCGVPGDEHTYYMGAAGGGVWKTGDSGKSWQNISDGTFGGSIGAVAIAPSDPNVIYVGGGEKTLRGNVSHGDGVYKSTDAGRTWKHIGLPESRHVCRIRVHPTNSDVVYAAALGHLFGPNEERGVYRSTDGGTSWERVLFVSDKAGCVDLCMDPTNPRILYATIWQVRRTPYSLDSGGPDSGIYKSTDSGTTWENITRNEGLPTGTIGIAGVTVSRSNPDNVYAIVEAENGGVFRSRDAGKTWKRTNKERSLRQRAWYYTRIQADPADENAVYVLNVRFWKSLDGGKNFTAISTPHGDNHDLWIAADDPKRMIQANDGGANVSHDGGKNWSPQDNQPTAQMYRVSVDSAVPYRLLGGQQDNSALRIRSRSLVGSTIGVRDWDPTAGGESGHIVAKPDEPDVVFGGSYGGYLTRVDHRTGQRRTVNVWPDNPMGAGADVQRFRFQWNFPLFFSPHDPSLLYAAAQCLFRSRDGGASWEQISDDLTTNDKDKQRSSGGPITQDNTGVEYYCTIFAALESPHERGVLWCGSDDGLIHVSRDDGKTWTDVTPNGLPKWIQINSIEAHPENPGGLYVAATMYKSDDFAPYLYKTTDYGASWTKITDGIDAQHFTRALRADPLRPGILYAGTERGVYVSFDDGAKWQPLQGDLPVVPVTDLAVQSDNLIAATQGRGYWILDDLQLVGQLAEYESSTAKLFEPRDAMRRFSGRSRSPRNAGTNPAAGAVLHYVLASEPDADVEVRLDILETDGSVIRSFTRKPAAGDDESKPPADQPDDDRQLTADSGLNTFEWNLRYASAEKFPKLVMWNGRTAGPEAVPGAYEAKLTVGEWSQTVPLRVVPDPLSSSSHEDRVAQFTFLLETRDKLTEIHRGIRKLRDVRTQVADLKKRLGDREDAAQVLAAADRVLERMKAVEEALYQTKNRSRQDPLNFPIRLNDKLAGLLSVAGRGDQRPTRQSYEVRAALTAAADAELATLQEIWTREVPALNRLVEDLGLPRISTEK